MRIFVRDCCSSVHAARCSTIPYFRIFLRSLVVGGSLACSPLYLHVRYVAQGETKQSRHYYYLVESSAIGRSDRAMPE